MAEEELTQFIIAYIENMRAERRLYPDLWAPDLAHAILNVGDDDAESERLSCD